MGPSGGDPFPADRFNDSVGERLVVLGWMEDAQRLPLSKLVLTVNAITHVMTISGSRSWHWVTRYLYDPGCQHHPDANRTTPPWIKQVSVRKQWPDELKIHLLNMCRLRGGMINTW